MLPRSIALDDAIIVALAATNVNHAQALRSRGISLKPEAKFARRSTTMSDSRLTTLSTGASRDRRHKNLALRTRIFNDRTSLGVLTRINKEL